MALIPSGLPPKRECSPKQRVKLLTDLALLRTYTIPVAKRRPDLASPLLFAEPRNGSFTRSTFMRSVDMGAIIGSEQTT